MSSTAATVTGGSPRRGRPSQRQHRVELALDVAAGVLNADGLTNASLEAVAEALGVRKSALYYYFQSKEDLVYKSYLRASQVGCANAEAASAAAGSGRERFIAYVRRQLSAENPPVTLASELDFLSPPHRQEILALTQRHEQALQGILEAGAEDGSLVAPYPRLVNFAIIGAMNWILVWLRPGVGNLTLQDVADGYLDVFLGGVSPAGQAVLRSWPAPVRLGDAAPAAAFDRAGHAERRREALVRSASEFFNRNGFDNCTLSDVADGLQISKSALYHYVSSKEELLYASYSRSLEKTELVLREIDAEDAPGLAKFMRTIASAVELHAGPAGPIANYTRLKSLTAGHHREVRARSERIEAILAGFFRQGVQDGSMRPVDARLARLAFLGSVNWLPKWYAPGGETAAGDIAASLAHLFVNGLQPRS